MRKGQGLGQVAPEHCTPGGLGELTEGLKHLEL